METERNQGVSSPILGRRSPILGRQEGRPATGRHVSRGEPQRGRVLSALAAGALLGLAACGPSEQPAATDPAPVEETTSAPSADPEATTQSSAPPASDGGGTENQPDGEETTASDVPGSEEGRPLIIARTVPEDRVTVQDGEKRLPAQELAAVLEELGGVAEETPDMAEPATCENDLRYVPSADVRCTVTATFDGSSEERVFVAHPITAPGGASGVLFTADEPLTEEARWATFNGDNEVVALGMGGVYGMEPVPAEQLMTDVQTALDFDYRDEGIDTSGWDLTAKECEGELDFERLAPVKCTAEDAATSQSRTVWALPGTFFGQEPGLIVSVETAGN